MSQVSTSPTPSCVAKVQSQLPKQKPYRLGDLHGLSASLPPLPWHYTPPLPPPYPTIGSPGSQPSEAASIGWQTPAIFDPELGLPWPHKAALVQLPQPG